MTMTRNNCIIYATFALIFFFMGAGMMIGARLVYNNNTTKSNTSDSHILGPDGIARVGPVRVCECSQNKFWGEDKIACLRPGSSDGHVIGDVVSFCIWSQEYENSFKIERVQEFVIFSSDNSTYPLISNGHKDVNTLIYAEDAATVVATFLDPRGFAYESAIVGLKVTVEGHGAFGFTVTDHPTRRVLGANETGSMTTTTLANAMPVHVVVAAWIMVLLVLLTLAVIAAMAWAMVANRRKEAAIREQYWESGRQRQMEEFGKYLASYSQSRYNSCALANGLSGTRQAADSQTECTTTGNESSQSTTSGGILVI